MIGLWDFCSHSNSQASSIARPVMLEIIGPLAAKRKGFRLRTGCFRFCWQSLCRATSLGTLTPHQCRPNLTPDPASGERRPIVARRRVILGDCAPRVGELLPDSHFSEAITFFFHAGDRFVKYLVDLQRLHRELTFERMSTKKSGDDSKKTLYQFKLFPTILPVFFNPLSLLSYHSLLPLPFSSRSHSLHSCAFRFKESYREVAIDRQKILL